MARATEVQAKPGHMLIVTTSDAAEAGMKPLMDFRLRQGWRVSSIKANVGCTSAPLIRLIRAMDAASSRTLTHLLLVGDDGVLPMARIANGSIQRNDRARLLATDEPYSLPDARGIPRLAVGRLPIDNARTLDRAVRKIIEYENSIGKLQPALFLMAGREFADEKPVVGGFSEQNLIDGICAAWIGELRGRGYPFALHIHTAYGGRDHFSAEHAVKVFGEELDAAPFLTVYAGHANRDCFATNHPGAVAPINRDTIGALDFKAISGPIFSDSCSMIDPGGGGRPLGEMLVLARRGPVAFIGFTGINDDFVAMQALEIVAAWLKDARPTTVGEIMREWKTQLVTQPQSARSKMDQFFMGNSGQLTTIKIDYRRTIARNNAMLNLIGDPATTFVIPGRSLAK